MMRLLVVLPLMLAACGHATLIHRDPSGGVFELGGNRNKAMDDARRQMADHCRPDGFAITEEAKKSRHRRLVEPPQRSHGHGVARALQVRTAHWPVNSQRLGCVSRDQPSARWPPPGRAGHATRSRPPTSGASSPRSRPFTAPLVARTLDDSR